ncbi:esterase/lipase family protein [Archangium lansingense]|uniref:esterase/lipase family protein n=1 Tax=Archangium lansingense TaxID=2995310 RepID=UPI003B7C6EDB
MAKHRVYLIPGFFGFTHMGEKPAERIVYFGHVRDVLLEGFQKRGHTAEVEPLTGHPTASLEVRARLLLRSIEESAANDDAAIHLVGHSTGGLDARGLVSTWMPRQAPHLLERVRSVVTVATPHHGAPMARFFLEDRRGEMLLRLLWLFTVFSLRRGPRPMMFLAFRLFYALSETGHQLGFQATLLDQVTRLLAHLSPTEQATLEEFLAQVGKDQSIIGDLTPEKLVDFNRNNPDRAGVRYGSVITGAPPPSLLGMLRAITGKNDPGMGDLVSLRMLDPEPEVIYGAYSFLYKKSGPNSRELVTPEPSPTQDRQLRDVFEEYRSRSDGVVPTRTQLWGELITAVIADHLDVLGHYDDPPEHVGWLRSGSHFRSPQFQGLWDRVLDFMVDGSKAHP